MKLEMLKITLCYLISGGYLIQTMIQGEPNKMKKIKQKEDVLMREIYQLLTENLKR